jgi:ribosomal protein L11 methyltransferase
VIANILANPLVELAPRLTRLLAPDGVLVLSGLLVEQEGMIRSAYPGVGFAPAVVEEEWIRLDGRVG